MHIFYTIFQVSPQMLYLFTDLVNTLPKAGKRCSLSLAKPVPHLHELKGVANEPHASFLILFFFVTAFAAYIKHDIFLDPCPPV